METTINNEIMKVEQLVCEECGEVLTDLVEGEDYVVINNNGSNHIVGKDCLSVSTLTDNLFFCEFHNRIESEEDMKKTIVNPEMTGEYAVCENGLYALKMSGEISKCDGCGEYFSNENTNYDGYTSVCNNCWENGEYELCNMDKKVFVEKELNSIITIANPDIAWLEYIVNDMGEFVIVTMNNNYHYKIDVTADSLIALIADVVNFMKWK